MMANTSEINIKENKLSKRLSFRLTEIDWLVFESLRNDYGLDRSAFLRMMITESDFINLMVDKINQKIDSK